MVHTSSHQEADYGSPRSQLNVGPQLPPPVWRLIHAQEGLLALWQARRFGVDQRSLQRAVRRREGWRRVGKRTVMLGPLPLSGSQGRIRAILEVGSRARLGGLAALQEMGWEHGCDFIDIVVPRGHRANKRKLPGAVRLHFADVPSSGLWEVSPSADSVRPVPRTAAARSLVDAAAWARSSREATFVVVSTLQAGLTSVDDLSVELQQRSNTRRRGLVRQIVVEFQGGSQSMGELDFVRECRRRGLPEPRRQVSRRDASGRSRFTDAEFAGADGRIVMVEIDGVGHMSAESWIADMERHNDLAMVTGAVVLRVSTWQLRHQPEPFFRRLETVLAGAAN